MNRIDDDLLNGVSGGNSTNGTITVDVDLPHLDASVTFKAYFDGMLHYAKGVHTSYLDHVSVACSAAGGKHSLVVNINDVLYRQYELDFDTGTILVTW